MLLALALVTYATLSTPFPRHPGLPEGIVGLLLLLSVGISELAYIGGGFLIHPRRPPLTPELYSGFIFLLITPLLVGATAQWDVVDIIRDIIPLGYLFLPIFLLVPLTRGVKGMGTKIAWVLAGCGTILAVRFFFEIGSSPLAVGAGIQLDNLLYLPYDPTVLFAAIFLPIMAIQRFKLGANLIQSAICMTCGLVAIASQISVVQRSAMVLIVVSLMFYVATTAFRSMLKASFMIAIFMGLVFLIREQVIGAFDLVIQKQQSVGLNAKDQELWVVLDTLSSSVLNLLAGIGWGGIFVNPAENNIRVSFTHSLVSYILLKTGILGMLSIGFYAWAVMRATLACAFGNLAVALAGSSTLLIGLLLQPTYKTLTYGLVVLCLMACHTDLKKDRERLLGAS